MNNHAVLFAVLQKSLYRFAAMAQTVLVPETPFERSWVNRVVHTKLIQMEEGGHPRLILNVPNGYHNRMMISTARVAWKLGQDPNRCFLIILPRVDDIHLSIDQLMVEFMKLFKADFYSAIFPHVEPSQISSKEIGIGDNGRISITRACEHLPPYPVDHIISIDAEYDYRLINTPETSQEANWLINTAFKKLNVAPHSSVTVLNKRTSWVDISTLLKSGDHGHWEHLEILHQSNSRKTYQIRRNGDNKTYTAFDGEMLPKDPAGFNPGYENTIQNMALHNFLFAINDEVPGVWEFFQTSGGD